MESRRLSALSLLGLADDRNYEKQNDNDPEAASESPLQQ
jgi:hypothetical protein